LSQEREFPPEVCVLSMLPQFLVLLASLVCADGFGLVSASGGSFYEDGHPTRYAGTNSLSLAQFSNPFGYSDLFTRMARANMTLLRLWAFSDGEACSPAPQQNYFRCWDAAAQRVATNESALALHLDAALAAASRAGIHILLSLVNNWPAYGGIAAYTQWRQAAAAAGVAPPLSGAVFHDDFYVDPIMRGWYREWVSTIVGRVNTVTGVAYRADPTIFAWELGNELACTNSSAAAPCVVGGTSPPMRAWVAEMSSLIKSMDSSHMVAIGDEGFYGSSPPRSTPCPRQQWWCTGAAGDWLGLLQLPGIDFGTLHMYPDSFRMGEWGIGSEGAVARGWVVNHTGEAQALGKPVLLEEVGNGAAAVVQHELYGNYTQAALEAGTGGWAVWMLASLDSIDFHPPNYPNWWKGGDAQLQVYCTAPGDPAPPTDGGSHDPDTCAVLAAAASRLHWQGGPVA
jgi:mannan endo-1,4-beta-mannosidase